MSNLFDVIMSIFFLLLLIAVIVLPLSCLNNFWENDAVEHGYAEYYLNENYVRNWRWIDERPNE